MKNPFILGAVFVGAFFAAILYFKPTTGDSPASKAQAVQDERAPYRTAKPVTTGSPSRIPGRKPPATQQAGLSHVPSDPRLAALQVSPDNGLIEFVRGSDGEVIAEIDKDPGSLGFRKPSREYTYSAGKVAGVTSYRYLPGRVEVSKTVVSYKPDGSVDQFSESSSYHAAAMSPKRDR